MYTVDEDVLDDYWEKMIGADPLEDMRRDLAMDYGPCLNILSDENLYKKLKSLHFDMGILDSFPYARCFVILLYRSVRF